MNIATRAFLGALSALILIGPSYADTFSFNLSTANPALAGFAGPYASVLVNRTDLTHATLTYTSLTNSGNIYLFGDGGSVAANINAAAFTVGPITGTNSGVGFTPGPYLTSSGNENGFGNFNLIVDSFDGLMHSSDSISFTLTAFGSTWASAATVLGANSVGSFAGAHIFVTPSPANAANGALVTGFAANGGANEIPEPGVLVLVATGLMLLKASLRTRARRLGER